VWGAPTTFERFAPRPAARGAGSALGHFLLWRLLRVRGSFRGAWLPVLRAPRFSVGFSPALACLALLLNSEASSAEEIIKLRNRGTKPGTNFKRTFRIPCAGRNGKYFEINNISISQTLRVVWKFTANAGFSSLASFCAFRCFFLCGALCEAQCISTFMLSFRGHEIDFL